MTAVFDNSGNVVERYIYDPYGTPGYLTGAWASRSASLYAWLHLHQGGRWEAQSRLYHFRHRDLSPSLGRWLTLDPIRFEAGDVNLYRYVFNAPTNFTDPSGQIVWFFVIGGVAAGWYLLGPGAGTANAPAPGQEKFRTPPRPFVEDAIAGLPGAIAGGGAALAGEAACSGVAALLRRRPRGAPAPFNPANYVGRQAVTSPHLPAGTYAALVVDGQVYVARMHNVAWELAGRTGNVQFYGSAQIDAAGRVVRLFQ